MSENDKCETCEVSDWGYKSDGKLIPVWEQPSDYEDGAAPDYIGCTNCGTMRPVEDGAIQNDAD